MKFKHCLPLLRLTVPAAILTYLIYSVASNPDQVANLRLIFSGGTRWYLIGLAFLVALAALTITILRWYLLVITLGLPFTLVGALRLGFLGYLLNFVGVGGVGGDLFKAIILARQQMERRAEAFATVVVDRLIGLYSLLVVTALVSLTIDFQTASLIVQTGARAVRVCAVVGTILGGLMLMPGFSNGSFSEFLVGLPKVGGAFQRVMDAIRLYRGRPDVLALIGVMSLMVHILFAFSVYCVAHGVFPHAPTYAEMLIISPMAMVFAAIPIAPGGLGTLELALSYLYTQVPAESFTEGEGLSTALGFRAITIGLAFIGALFYWLNRDTVQSAYRDVEQEQDQQEKPSANENSPISPESE
ncbi:MAG: lysylphosphatidylglycerol synthase transmembrane domain-containing protein [Pirellulaceae bacterium]